MFVGAGYAGLEGLAELQDFAADVIERYPRARLQGMRFMLVEAQRPRDARDLARPGRVRDGRAAPARDRDPHRDDDRARRRPLGDALHAARSIPTRTVAWTAGRQAAPGGRASSGCRSTAAAGSSADRYCAVAGRPDVWAIGDAAAVPDPARKGSPSPPTAQHVLRQAKVAADNVAPRSAASRTSGARSATARSACSSTWAATRPSRARSGSSGAASRRGSSPARTTWR